MAIAVVKRRQVARQLQSPGGTHRMADKALSVIEARLVARSEHLPQRLALLSIALAGAGGMRADNVDVFRRQAGSRQGERYAFSLPLGIRQHEVRGVSV